VSDTSTPHEIITAFFETRDTAIFWDNIPIFAAMTTRMIAQFKERVKAERIGLSSRWMDNAIKEYRQQQTAVQATANEGNLATIIKIRGLEPVLADLVLQNHHFAVDSGDKLYYYADGCYLPKAEQQIGVWANKILTQHQLTAKWYKGLGDAIAANIRDRQPPLLWEIPPVNRINCTNGILDVSVTPPVLRPHTPKFLSMTQCPWPWEPNATCDETDRIIQDILPNDAPNLLYEILGLLLIPYMDLQKAIMLYGEGGCGKSTLLELIQVALGSANCTNKSLQELEERFMAARLVGKLANICPDIPAKAMTESSKFKKIVGGDSIPAENKNCDPFDFKPYARLIFSANTLPRSADSSEAFYDRWIIVHCTKRHRAAADEIRREVIRATFEREMPGILVRAVACIPQILQHGITVSPSMHAALEEFRIQTNPITVWLKQHTVMGPSTQVKKDQLMRAYNAWADHKGLPFATEEKIAKAVRRFAPDVQDLRPRDGDERFRVWSGIGLVDETAPFQQKQPWNASKREESSDYVPDTAPAPDVAQWGPPHHAFRCPTCGVGSRVPWTGDHFSYRCSNIECKDFAGGSYARQ
jgi:putative DNA primase/helicase